MLEKSGRQARDARTRCRILSSRNGGGWPRMELVQQPEDDDYWLRRDATKLPSLEATLTQIVERVCPWLMRTPNPHAHPGKRSIFGVSEESNGVPTSFRYVGDRLLEAACGLPRSPSPPAIGVAAKRIRSSPPPHVGKSCVRRIDGSILSTLAAQKRWSSGHGRA